MRFRASVGQWLCVIVLVGAVLRFFPIWFGLPYLHARPDEDVAVSHALDVLAGDFNPHFFEWPSLTFYVFAGLFAPVSWADRVIATDNRYGNARPDRALTRELATQEVRPHLDAGFTVIFTGFIGRAPDASTTTLGRGGSDYSATLLGAALDAVPLDAPGAILVYPRLVHLEALFSESGRHSQDGRRLLLRRPSGFDLHSVREYEQGESLRKVHWASIAETRAIVSASTIISSSSTPSANTSSICPRDR